jgi:hypothetical protein
MEGDLHVEKVINQTQESWSGKSHKLVINAHAQSCQLRFT